MWIRSVASYYSDTPILLPKTEFLALRRIYKTCPWRLKQARRREDFRKKNTIFDDHLAEY